MDIETSGTMFCLYMRFSPRSNWILQCRSNDIECHNRMIEMVKRDCFSNFANWLDRHSTFQLGEFIFTTDNIYLQSIEALDNFKPSDTRVKVIYSHGSKENE